MRALVVLTAISFAASACTYVRRNIEDARPPLANPSTATPALEITAEPTPIATSTPTPSMPSERQTLLAESGHVVEVYPPFDTDHAAPLVVFLHATCMQPLDVCDFWSRAGRESTWLVCPAGPSTCAGAPDWSGPPKVKAAALGAALAKVDEAFTPWIDRSQGDVLIGYSRGAFAARDILYEGMGRFRGLILLSAAVSPDPARLKAAGIRRAVMATGDLDGSRATMLRAVQTLEGAGIPTKFMSLGKIGHWLPNDLESILRDAIAWVEAPAS